MGLSVMEEILDIFNEIVKKNNDYFFALNKEEESDVLKSYGYSGYDVVHTRYLYIMKNGSSIVVGVDKKSNKVEEIKVFDKDKSLLMSFAISHRKHNNVSVSSIHCWTKKGYDSNLSTYYLTKEGKDNIVYESFKDNKKTDFPDIVDYLSGEYNFIYDDSKPILMINNNKGCKIGVFENVDKCFEILESTYYPLLEQAEAILGDSIVYSK